jgi:DNA repair protein RecO (recombination protein O)
MKVSTPAIVLKTTLFKESSLIARLFTLEKGKNSYVIKSAMSQKSPLKSIYQQINEIEVNYTNNNKRQLQPIYDSKLLNGWNSINFDLKKMMLCLSIIEMIDRGFDEGDRDTETYYLLKNVLHYFDLEHNGYNDAFYFFVLHFLKNIGYNVIEAKEHPIVKSYLSQDQKLLQQLKEIYISNFLEEKNKKHIFNYNKKIMASFISDLIRYHLPDIKSFAVAKEIFQ